MNLDDAVATLADTPDGIAEQLKTAGVKGRKLWAHACPVSIYLTNLTGYKVWSAPSNILGGNQIALTPPELALFMGRFDAGLYPELIGS